MDDVDDLPYLESLAKQYCTDNGSEIQAAAMALVLSLFYLRVDRILCNHSQSYQIHGTIRCRLQKDLHLLGIAKLINNIIAQHYFEHDGDALFCISVGSGSESRRSPAKLPGTSAKDIDVYTDSVALKTQFSVGNFNDELSIYLATGRKSEPKGLISGFPCTITELKHRYRKIGNSDSTAQIELIAPSTESQGEGKRRDSGMDSE
ncbi:hypothetical protein FPQ18DRAFT_307026 [Pyronema domesticum]|nr:hypothetical protein FPQ18DRAFT_307026 [Pyronema domesticum]